MALPDPNDLMATESLVAIKSFPIQEQAKPEFFARRLKPSFRRERSSLT